MILTHLKYVIEFFVFIEDLFTLSFKSHIGKIYMPVNRFSVIHLYNFTPNDIMVPIEYLLQGEVIEPFWAPLFAGQVYIVDWQGHRLRVADDKITLSSRITSAVVTRYLYLWQANALDYIIGETPVLRQQWYWTLKLSVRWTYLCLQIKYNISILCKKDVAQCVNNGGTAFLH